MAAWREKATACLEAAIAKKAFSGGGPAECFFSLLVGCRLSGEIVGQA